MMKRAATITLVATWVMMGLLLNGALGETATGQSETDLSSVRVNKIGVMPFYRGKYGGVITSNLSCNVCQLVYDPNGLDPDAGYFLASFTQDVLKKRFGQKVVPLKKSLDAHRQMPKDDFKDTIQTRAQKLGRTLNANLIVAGNVWRYKDKVGGSRGIQSPSSVGFAVYLIEVASGKLLWKSAFSETQKSLSENVLEAHSFLKKGAKWLTVNELAQFGVNELFEKFPL